MYITFVPAPHGLINLASSLYTGEYPHLHSTTSSLISSSAMLYRASAARSVLRAVSSSNASVARSVLGNPIFKAQLTSSARAVRPAVKPNFALAAHKPVTTALIRHASSSAKDDDDVDMMAGMKAEAKVIGETFSLKEVPKEAMALGMAGVLPYLATSLQTVYLSWEINRAANLGEGLLFSGQSAELMLHMIEPIQVGFGAVILSFLGAVHWGLEWAGYGGKFGYRRYAAGVIAPAVAWPTLLLPVEYALISQFLAFTFLYYNDARAAATGRAPHWYGMYRFVLTFVVGASIVATLIGREQIQQNIVSEHTIKDKINALMFLQKKEKEEAEARRKGELAGADE
ncbi:Uncharacterized protein PECH_004659 [Penicillium ucsense]|uniref:Transmembrane protein 69 n=1 Tax=Penicillium ucsense TaxID=2839758 RepID=A0A8J8W6R4_9EURO|nr:Uncharacterized protein PECM_003416 [Penicillium ucsense]KAF7736855.1 Uncharacterized protein PECH_004659 [Penicillium ucsense]